MHRCGILALVLVFLAGAAWAQKPNNRAAAHHFKKGEGLYNRGEFAEAIKEFTRAHELSPHATCLFNIARSHENLGAFPQALDFYRQALAVTKDAASKADIERRMRRIESRPVKVFVSSEPSGARVTVDGRPTPEAGQTPLAVTLVPGGHVLVLRLEGHHLAALRVKVEMDKELPVKVALDPLPAPCPPPPPPCPTCPEPKECPRLELTDLDGFGLHLSIMGALYIAADRPFTGGPGFQLYATWRRFIVGLHLTAFPAAQEQTDITLGSEDPMNPASIITEDFTKADYRLTAALLDGGYTFPFRSSYLYATLGMGIFSDKVTYSRTSKTKRDVSATAFTWSLGGGIEAMVTTWLSIGAGLRVGAIHGDRLDEKPAEIKPDTTKGESFEPYVPENKLTRNEAIQPYMTIWGSITLHL